MWGRNKILVKLLFLLLALSLILNGVQKKSEEKKTEYAIRVSGIQYSFAYYKTILEASIKEMQKKHKPSNKNNKQLKPRGAPGGCWGRSWERFDFRKCPRDAWR